MSSELLPTNSWTFPLMRFTSLADDTSWLQQSTVPSGLSITEDDEYVYVDAALPGVKTNDIEISFHNGVLRVTGEVQEEEKKKRKSYHKMTSSFSYQVAVPGEVDLNADPEAMCSDGVLTVIFPKVKAAAPKKIVISSKLSAKSKKATEEKVEKPEEKEEVKVSKKEAPTLEENTIPETLTHDEEIPEVTDELDEEVESEVAEK